MAKFLSLVIAYCFCNAKQIVARSVFFLVIGLLWSVGAKAIDGEMTKAEYELLPHYCQGQEHVAAKYFKPDGNKWRNYLGEKDYSHIHHYCWGLVNLNRAYKAGISSRERKHLFRYVIGDIMYSVDRASPEFALLPEMYTKIGEAYLGLQDDKNAEIAFRKAWEINPAYWPPYVWWSQRLLKQGKVREALAVAEEGKKNVPDSKSLNQLIKDIRAGKATR